MSDETRISRRASLAKLGGLVVAAASVEGWKAAVSQGETDSGSSSTTLDAVASGLVSCVLSPEMTEGPYYVPGDKIRRNATFLRGVQRTDAKGVARFRTIYPGWYPGRTVHIHVKVALGGNVVHTGQLFFSDKLTDALYKRSPYNRRPGRSTRNATDSIFRNGGSRSLLRLARSGTGYAGTIAMGVQR